MDEAFKAWLIENTDKWKPEEKEGILQMMKDAPERVKQIISANLEGWATIYCYAKREAVYVNIDSDTEELFVAYQEHFATELATKA